MKRIAYSLIFILAVFSSFFTGYRMNHSGSNPAGNPSKEGGFDLEGEEVEDDLDILTMAPGTVRITADKQRLLGIEIGVVQKKPMVQNLRLLGRVEADETRIYRINAPTDGWIQKTYPNSVGTYVKKGEVLATFSNPQFLDAEQGYLFAVGTVERLRLGKRQELGRQGTPTAGAHDPFVLQRQIDLLRGLGVEDSQIEEIGRTRRISLDIRITAPVSGFVTARKVSPMERFVKGDELFRIEDLRRVWILVDAYEEEAGYFKPGDAVVARLPYRNRTYQTIVSKVLPIFDPLTRTSKVRLETDNPEFLLRPDMLADVELRVSIPPVLTLAEDAILDSGRHHLVFIALNNGIFEPRRIETGRRIGNRVEIVSGLEPGERVVTSGNFFVSSESRLQLAAQGIYGEPSITPDHSD